MREYKLKRLQLEHLTVGYRRRHVLTDVNLDADEGELVALIGRNGTGKSTLMRTIARLQALLSGEIYLLERPINSFTKNEWAENLSIVSTEAVAASHLTVRQLVAFGRFPYTNWLGRMTADDNAHVEQAMRDVGIAHLADKKLHETSDGERQRAMIARTLAQNTAVILLDEPTAFLDLPNRYEMIDLLHRLTHEQGKTIIFSTHDLNIAMRKADKLWLVAPDGVSEGAPAKLADDGSLKRLFEGTAIEHELQNLRRYL